MTCIICAKVIRNGFSYFCRICYRLTHKKLPITNLDLKHYLELTFDKEIKISSGWTFKTIHTTVTQTHEP